MSRYCAAVLEEKLEEKIAISKIRSKVMNCFWSWPFGHCFHAMLCCRCPKVAGYSYKNLYERTSRR